LIDDWENATQNPGSNEALYIESYVCMDSDVYLDLNNLNLYLSVPTSLACPEDNVINGLITPVEKTLFGDWNNDCQIQAVELIALRRIILGVDPYDPLYDWDCDGVINDEVEGAVFTDNFAIQPSCSGQLASAPCGGPGGDENPEAQLAEYCRSIMAPTAINEYVDRLIIAAETIPNTHVVEEIWRHWFS
jgi:hypothetical protein